MINLSGFLQFIRDDMGITADQLPDSNASIIRAYNGAVEWVNGDLLIAMPYLYETAVYNLAASFLVNWGSADVLAELRKTYTLNSLNVGVISSASDNGTSQSRLVPDFFKNLSLTDLQMLRDPWGRAYLMIAQQFGSLWGLT